MSIPYGVDMPEGPSAATRAGAVVTSTTITLGHERAGTDLKGALEGMVANYRGHRPRAMRVVQDALAQPAQKVGGS